MKAATPPPTHAGADGIPQERRDAREPLPDWILP
jgi:hypothetical protein